VHDQKLAADKNRRPCSNEASDEDNAGSDGEFCDSDDDDDDGGDDVDDYQDLCLASTFELNTRELGHFVKVSVHMNDDGTFHCVVRM
jgi:hypothetical protein